MNNTINVEAFDSALNIIRQSEAAIRDAANEWAPRVIQAVIAGDNIVHVNKLRNAFSGIRKARVTSILKRFVPFEFDSENDQFTTKLKNAKLAAKRTEAFEVFQQSEDTFWSLVEEVKKADKKPVDTVKALKKAAAAAAADGIEFDTMLAIITLAIKEAAVEEEAQA